MTLPSTRPIFPGATPTPSLRGWACFQKAPRTAVRMRSRTDWPCARFIIRHSIAALLELRPSTGYLYRRIYMAAAGRMNGSCGSTATLSVGPTALRYVPAKTSYPGTCGRSCGNLQGNRTSDLSLILSPPWGLGIQVRLNEYILIVGDLKSQPFFV